MDCKYCESEMTIDDIDKISPTNKDIYWICESCGSSCIENISQMDNKSISVKRWTKGE